MDNALTPKRIERLIHLAEGKATPSVVQPKFDSASQAVNVTQSTASAVGKYESSSGIIDLDKLPSISNYESSSGIIDLDKIEGFGESCNLASMSLSKSTAFNPGEMTGRSTEASQSEMNELMESPSRQSVTNPLTDKMLHQTYNVANVMGYSIATNFSIHSKQDLTADEASFVAQEAPLPVMHSTQTYTEPSNVSTSNVSVGSYFKKKCDDFGQILGNNESPNMSLMMPSISEVSQSQYGYYKNDLNAIQLDDMLDSVPVRQPRETNIISIPEKQYQPFQEPPKAPLKVESAKNIPEINSKKGFPALLPQKSFMSSNKPSDMVLKNLVQSSHVKLPVDDTETSVDNSISLSRIAEFLGNNQSNFSVSEILKLNHNKKPTQPNLRDINMNAQKTRETFVKPLADSKKTETASSAGTITTVVPNTQAIVKPPELIVTESIATPEQRLTRSKSPSTKSQSTMSTVRDNYSSFKSGGSPNSSKGEANRSKPPSPNVVYKELDKSVDWKEVLHQKQIMQRGQYEEQWVDITAESIEGYVGSSTSVTITVTTVADSWLTAKFQFINLPCDPDDLNVELPRIPLLLSPGKTEHFKFQLIANIELNATLPFIFQVKDTSIDGDVEQKGELKVNFKLPNIQAMSSDGINKLLFPPIQESTVLTKTFVLISDCPAELQLMLSLTEGESIFSIKNVQEIKKGDVNKILLQSQGSDEQMPGQSKAKAMNKKLCRLINGKALKVTVAFSAPKLADLNMSDTQAAFKGVLNVTPINGRPILRKVDLIAVVGTAELVVKFPENVAVTKEPIKFFVKNVGKVSGTWQVKCMLVKGVFPFNVSPTKFHLMAGEAKEIHIAFTGDECAELPIRFENILTGNGTEVSVNCKVDQMKPFPIKSNYATMSWVRAGRKEVSLKNNLDKKVHIRCTLLGEGFSLDLPGWEAGGVYVLSFNAFECRPLSIVFSPPSTRPYSAALHMVYDNNTQNSKKIKLFGYESGVGVRWSGLVTYSDSAALVRAAGRTPINLTLHNKSHTPAFVAASLHFNLQYMCVAPRCGIVGARRIIPGRSHHTLSLRVDWGRVERRARQAGTTALATLTVLTGAQCTRLRILKILRDNSNPNGPLDTSILPDHLKVLANTFEGEDSSMDSLLADFSETKASLDELIGGLQELTAHIDLPHDFAEDAPVLVNDDTALDHHTLCD